MVINLNMPANWRTQLPGVLAAAALGVGAYAKDGKLDVRDPFLWGAVLLAISNYYSKAKNVTGGTTENSSNDPTVVKATTEVKAP